MSKIDYEVESAKRMNWMDLTGGPASGGLTMLDYFAGKALEYLASMAYTNNFSHEERAKWVYDQAEALLAERNKRFTPTNVVRGVTGRTYG